MITKDVSNLPTCGLQTHNDASAIDAVSATLNLNVLKPSRLDTRLPRPAIADAHGNELDLGAFLGDTTTTCVPWPLIAVGQKVWLAVNGILANGKATTLPLWTASGVTASEVRNGLSKALPRTWLDSLRNGSSIAVRLDVSFDGSIDIARAVELPALNLTVRASEFNLVDDFDKYELGTLTKGRSLDFLYYNRDDPSPWSVVTAPEGLKGRCLRLRTSSPLDNPYAYLLFTDAYSRLTVSIVEFTYIAMSAPNSKLTHKILHDGFVYWENALIVDRKPHTLRIQIPSYHLSSFYFGNDKSGPGTIDLYVDNLKLKDTRTGIVHTLPMSTAAPLRSK